MKRSFIILLLCIALITVSVIVFFPENGKAANPNILIITIDTLRADRLGSYGYPLNLTPHLNSLAEESLKFERHLTQAPLTLPSHSSLLTGLYPFNHGARSNITYRLQEPVVSLTEIFKKKGYRTGAVISAGVLHPIYGLNQGFDYYSWEEEGTSSKAQTDAAYATQRATTWLESVKEGERFFFWIHYFDLHGPYDTPLPPRFKFDLPYDGRLAYVDEQIGKVLNLLKEKEVFDSSLIILTSDHGENLGEHDYRGHVLSVYEQTMHIPLLIKWPHGKHGGKQINTITRSIDIFPTVLSSLNIPYPGRTDGVDLWEAINEDFPYPELESYSETTFNPVIAFHKKSLLSGRWKLISKYNLSPHIDMTEHFEKMKYEEGPENIQKWVSIGKRFEKEVRELYDLLKDPGETNNLYYLNPQMAMKMEERLKGYQPAGNDKSPEDSFEPDADLLKKLESLGY